MTMPLPVDPVERVLEHARALVLRGDLVASAAVLTEALEKSPSLSELQFALAGVLSALGRHDRAEALLRHLLQQEPGHTAATLLLARLLKDQGRMHAMAMALRDHFECGNGSIEDLLRAIEMLDEAGRQQDAAAVCEKRIAAGSQEPRLHAYAGMLLAQLGEFALARKRRLFALNHDILALDWHVPLGLADQQRYDDPGHPDMAMFHGYLRSPGLSPRARAGLLFALGKAHDDLGNYAQAAEYLREANALARAETKWSRKLWRRSIDARIARRPIAPRVALPSGWAPVFIVGMPRSGTTLLAEHLAEHPQVCHRGELGCISLLAERLGARVTIQPSEIEEAATAYSDQLVQDDSTARWFIDKQPLNFLHVDIILAMFPDARIIYCMRGTRDNALSLWMQSFQLGNQAYAYDFSDIGAAILGSRRLLAHWQTRYPNSIHVNSYEAMASDPIACFTAVSAWLGLPALDRLGPVSPADANRPISTASLWQARQPIHKRSVGRWRHYAEYLPELLRLPVD